MLVQDREFSIVQIAFAQLLGTDGRLACDKTRYELGTAHFQAEHRHGLLMFHSDVACHAEDERRVVRHRHVFQQEQPVPVDLEPIVVVHNIGFHGDPRVPVVVSAPAGPGFFALDTDRDGLQITTEAHAIHIAFETAVGDRGFLLPERSLEAQRITKELDAACQGFVLLGDLEDVEFAVVVPIAVEQTCEQSQAGHSIVREVYLRYMLVLEQSVLR